MSSPLTCSTPTFADLLAANFPTQDEPVPSLLECLVLLNINEQRFRKQRVRTDFFSLHCGVFWAEMEVSK